MEVAPDKDTVTFMSKETVYLNSLHKITEKINNPGDLLVKSEKLVNCSVLTDVKQEPIDLPEAASLENACTFSNKMQPESNKTEIKRLVEDSLIYEESKPNLLTVKLESTLPERNDEYSMDILHPILSTGLNGSDDSSKGMMVSVKSEDSVALDQIEEKSDFVEYNIKQEQLDLKDEDLELNHTIVLSDETDEDKTSRDYKHKCHMCEYRTNKKRNFNMHLQKHQNPEEIPTVQKNLKTHQRQHKNREDFFWWKCGLCEYQTLQKFALKQHVNELHKYFNDDVYLKCYLNVRILQHAKRKGTDTNRKHTLRHENLNEIETIKCAQCKHETVWKSNLKRHLLIHRDPKEANVFRCDKCDFTTIYRSSLTRHSLRHKRK